MPTNNLDAIFYIGTVPVIEFKDGLFHVCYNIGKRAHFEVVMPPRVFMQARLQGADVLAKWRLDGLPDDSKVVGIGKR